MSAPIGWAGIGFKTKAGPEGRNLTGFCGWRMLRRSVPISQYCTVEKDNKMTISLEITEQTTLGELVTFFPAITPRLNALQIDYCCQGDRSVQTAMQENGLGANFLSEIQQAYQ
jgi:hypothetical protein